MFNQIPQQQRLAQQGMFSRGPSQQRAVQQGLFNRVPPQQGMFNQQHQGRSFGQQQARGGLLSKLLGKGQPVQPKPISMFSLPTASKPETGGLLASLKNPGSLNSFLSNTQKVLQAAESVGPMIQQYGPLVKNFPALWKLYKGLKESDTGSVEDPESEDYKDSLHTTELEDEKLEDYDDSDQEEIKLNDSTSSKPAKNHEKKYSAPRLFF
ncbi:hypothetical protein CVD28_23045 [Bacillus sp. M6-12]|nr:hypothetical protein CVD28_23045 [Bacillus sp. M6-12]